MDQHHSLGAAIAGVLWVSWIIPLLLFIKIGVPQSWHGVEGIVGFLLMYYVVYFTLSLLGWALIGFPVHRFVCRIEGRHWPWYLLAVCLFTVGICYFFNVTAAAVLGGVAMSQL